MWSSDSCKHMNASCVASCCMLSSQGEGYIFLGYSQVVPPPKKEEKKLGGLVHFFAMQCGSPVPAEIMQLEYKFVVYEVDSSVCCHPHMH